MEINFKNIILQRYNEPSNKDILIIIPFFNPCNSIKLVNNLLLIKSKLDLVNIPYIIIDCLFPNSYPILEESKNYRIINSNSYGFMKENISNIIISENINNYEKFCIMDCDVIFDNQDWYNLLSKKLNNYDFIQPFSTCYLLNYDYNGIISNKKGFLYNKINRIFDQGVSGYVCSFTKSFWIKNGIYDEYLLGGNDKTNMSLIINKSIKYTFMNYNIYHLYHGSISKRQYETRHEIINKYINNKITSLIYKNDQGLYQWNSDIREDINNDVLKYFRERNDDDIETNINHKDNDIQNKIDSDSQNKIDSDSQNKIDSDSQNKIDSDIQNKIDNDILNISKLEYPYNLYEKNIFNNLIIKPTLLYRLEKVSNIVSKISKQKNKNYTVKLSWDIPKFFISNYIIYDIQNNSELISSDNFIIMKNIEPNNYIYKIYAIVLIKMNTNDKIIDKEDNNLNEIIVKLSN